ncbi:WbuC family cupin fold metalloprotein [Escherichia coli]|nr:WbuC family cupin fold metalloprotein [Escherichia coli]EJD8399689.1 WbuC family cupin fold metalloprotein [Escherichia coli]ELR1825104.1 WbuC family cupin fold metalloprotein [Escherichia coli]ELR3047165.1 WbuC family cupin fold metalloprotein [Escherichia coli]ELR3121669.1 WbuC family cupin fold metalloprotein [Escherichia coli]
MSVTVFYKEQLNELSNLASNNPRLRAHLNLHKSYQDKIQRILISLKRGTYIPPHYHKYDHQWEYFQVIEGIVDLYIFNNSGTVLDIINLGDVNGALFAQIEPYTIHTLVCRSPYASVIEIKEGPFVEAEAKIVPSWVYPEGCREYLRSDIVSMLETLKINEVYKL